VSEFNPGKNWRKIVKKHSIPNELDWGSSYPCIWKGKQLKQPSSTRDELSGELRKDIHFLLMAGNLLERMTHPTFNLRDKHDQDN
jgi:hypothetical protein